MSCPVCSSDRDRSTDILIDGATLRRCLACRVAHWDSAWDAHQVVAHYRNYYADRSVVWSPITEQRYHAILDRVEALRTPGRLLEVGCGTGHFLAVAAARGWQPVGLEISASAHEQIQRLNTNRPSAFVVHAIDVMDADFPPGQFQTAILIEVLEHMVDPRACLQRLHAWLAPGGVLYLTTPNVDSLSRFALGARWRAIEPEHRCLFNPRALATLLARSGFRPMRTVTKNIDLPEILAKWRSARRSTSPQRTTEATQALREAAEASRLLRTAKAVVNGMLKLTSLGETLEVLAVKRSGA